MNICVCMKQVSAPTSPARDPAVTLLMSVAAADRVARTETDATSIV